MRVTAAALVVFGAGATACTDAQIASQNLSRASDQFEIARRVVFYNGITDTYMLEVTGLCSIQADTRDGQLEVTCKTDDGFKKHYLGLSDNVSYFVEQVDAERVSASNYRVVFKPQVIVPDMDIRAIEPLPAPTINR